MKRKNHGTCDVFIPDGTLVPGNMHIPGNVYVGNNCTIYGNIYANDGVFFGKYCRAGEVIAGECVETQEQASIWKIKCAGNVNIGDDSSVVCIDSSGDVNLGKEVAVLRFDVKGEIRRNGRVIRGKK